MVLFSQLPYSGMGVFRKVTGDSFSRGWGIKPPARFFQSPKRYRTIDWTYFLRVKPVSGTTGSSRTRTLIPLWSPTLKSFSWRWGVILWHSRRPCTSFHLYWRQEPCVAGLPRGWFLPCSSHPASPSTETGVRWDHLLRCCSYQICQNTY